MKNTGKTILFVEDNPLVITIYRSWLQREGFLVESSGDGLDAIEKLPQMKPSLVILDLMLPMLDGLDVLKFIRENKDLKDTPVLILSNAYMDDRAEKAMKGGANKVLLKTQCTPARLIQSVREALGTEAFAQTSAPSADSSKLTAANEALLKETRENLWHDAPDEVAKIREHCLAFVKTAGTPANAGHLNHLYQRVRFLCARAGLGDCSRVGHLSSALEAMLFEIMFKKTSPSASALQTVAQSVDCLGRLFKNEDIQSSESTFKAKVLIVDDDPVCTFASVAAMKRARLEAVSTLDPADALQLARQDRFDIVLLDINMPGLNGFEVCEKLRLLPDYQNVPVIFVTSNSEFQNRAKAILSGGNDLIAKPISPLELALKTIIHLIDPPEKTGTVASQKQTAKDAPPVESPASKVDMIKSQRPDNIVPLPPKLPEKNGSRPLHGSAAKSNGNSSLRINVPSLPVTEFPRHPGPNKIDIVMKNPTPALDKLTNEITCILFGDDGISDMSLRLTRIALERYSVLETARHPVNGDAKIQPLDRVARDVATIAFGDNNVSEMHLRLMRIALEHHNVPQIISAPAESAARNGSHVAMGLSA